MLVALDTNVLLRLVNPHDPFHSCTRTALRVLYQRGDRFCFFPQNAAEFWNVCTRPATARGGYGLSVEEADRRLRHLHRLFDVCYEVPAAYLRWHALVTELRLTGVQVHDARIAALIQAHGILCLLTFDQEDFRRYSGFTTLSPHQFTA